MKVLMEIFLKVRVSILRELGLPNTLNRLSPHTPPNHIYRREIPCFMFVDVVNYLNLNNGDYPKPNWDFSYRVLWGVGISNDPNDRCRKSPHIFVNLNNGGQ